MFIVEKVFMMSENYIIFDLIHYYFCHNVHDMLSKTDRVMKHLIILTFPPMHRIKFDASTMEEITTNGDKDLDLDHAILKEMSERMSEEEGEEY